MAGGITVARYVYDPVTKECVQVPIKRGSTSGTDPWRTHASLSAGMPPACVESHREWIREQGLAGVEVRNDGKIHASSDRAFNRYLERRGLANYSNTGAGHYKGTGSSIPGME